MTDIQENFISLVFPFLVRYMYFNTCYNSYSMRVVPNDNDTTGFFCALITKVKELPSVISKLFTHSFL